MELGTHHPTLFILIFSVLPSAFSEIHTTGIISDARPLILFQQFGFSIDGRATISINSVSWSPPTPNLTLSSLGFFLLPDTSFFRITSESIYTDNFCPLSSSYSLPILTFQDLHGSTASHTALISSPDEYGLFFANCASNSTKITMQVHIEMYNVDTNGGKDYLSVGQRKLPTVYITFFMIYCVFLGAWGWVCHKHRMSLEKIHIVMAALLMFKALKLVCAAEDLWHVQRTGAPHGWDVAFYIFGFFKGVLLFTVIVLIGTGWSFLKPYLQDREKTVLMVIIPLQVIENIATAVIGEGAVLKNWQTWIQLFLLVDVVCCCLVIFPIIWSIRSLREASKTDGKAARNLQKLQLFKQFYVVVVGYLYFTRIIASMLGAALGYRHWWLVTAAVESVSLAFYIFAFYNFQPVERNPYLYIGDEEEEEAAEILQIGDLEVT